MEEVFIPKNSFTEKEKDRKIRMKAKIKFDKLESELKIHFEI
jgi:hypothetical protein